MSKIIDKFMGVDPSFTVVIPFLFYAGSVMDSDPDGEVWAFEDAEKEANFQLGEFTIAPTFERKDYENSWDMLIPVAQKCWHEYKRYRRSSRPNLVAVYELERRLDNIQSSLGLMDRGSVYMGVVLFIAYYDTLTQ
jgi:hypothetical protein